MHLPPWSLLNEGVKLIVLLAEMTVGYGVIDLLFAVRYGDRNRVVFDGDDGIEHMVFRQQCCFLLQEVIVL